MSSVNELEIVTQERILHKIFEEKLDYTYLGNFEDRENNSNIEEDLLLKFLLKKYPKEIAQKAIAELKKVAHNETKSLYEVNKEVYNMLKYGTGVTLYVGEKEQKVYFIDYEDYTNNDFYVAEEVTILGENEKRPDVVIYINGIAIGVIELKRSTVSINEGIRQNLDNQKSMFIERFFTTIQFVIAGNDTEGLKYATTLTPAKYYLPWIEDEKAIGELHEKVIKLIDKNDLLIDQQLPSLFEKERVIDLIDNFIIFDGGTKKVPRYNQYFGVTNAREYVKKHESGIIWHTQGSGKSISMVLIAKWILSNINDSRVLIFTDRKELDKQIEEVFSNAGEKIHRAKSCNDLLQSLNEYSKGRLICSLIHKVGTSVDEDSDKNYADYVKELTKYKNEVYSAKGDIFVFVDECHRSQAGLLHDEMKRILPNSTFIGFTGTPLMKKSKATTLEKFGQYIHTYKFDQAVRDGIVVDLCYESRNVEQRINKPEKIDEWFEIKTAGLNEFAKQKLKERWGTLQNVTSSSSRLEEIVKDIILDFGKIPRLEQGKGSAMLVASSIYEACRYWEIFQAKDFSKCAIISSYTPYISDVKGEEDGEFTLSDKQKIYSVYEKMWDKTKYPKLRSDNEYDDYTQCYEDDAIYKFIHVPAEMKVLIVVDRLLTGFDAPSATYLYIDKKMQNHGLFQAICRVNRLDKDKDLGYIVDYKDLFENIEGAVEDYTTGAFDDFDKEDISGLLKNRLEFGSQRLNKALKKVKSICEPVENPKGTLEILHYFVAEDLDTVSESREEKLKNTEARRIELYDAVSDLVIAYSNIADEMTKAGYTKEEIKEIKESVKYYNNARDEVMKSAGDYIELKNYDSSMRYMIDNYINAESSETQYKLEEATLLDIIVANGLDKATKTMPESFRNNKRAMALAIENNIASTIINSKNQNPRYYSKMSELLEELIEMKKEQNLDYQEYLEKLIELVKKVKNPESSGEYPKSMHNVRLRGLYDILDKNEDKTMTIYNHLTSNISKDFMESKMKQREFRRELSLWIEDESKEEEIFNLWKNTRGC